MTRVLPAHVVVAACAVGLAAISGLMWPTAASPTAQRLYAMEKIKSAF